MTAHEAIERLAGLSVDLVGANCGLGPQAALEALSEMAPRASELGIGLTAQPNVGLPIRVGGRLLYPNATPEYFSEFAAQARALGARLIGGCCGTTPAQIAAIDAAVAEGREPRIRLEAVVRERFQPIPRIDEKTHLASMLEAGEWVVSVELDPPKGANLDGTIELAQLLKDSGVVHAVDVNDNPMARARMSALTAVRRYSARRRARDHPACHAARCDDHGPGIAAPRRARDRHSQRAGGHRRSPAGGDYPGSRGVYEIDSIGLVQVLDRLNAGEDYTGKAIDAPTSFFVGVAVNPSAEHLAAEVERFRLKIEAGARFAMTQALFDLSYLDRFLDVLGGESPIPLLVGIWPLRSFQLAFRLHNEVPGIIVPDTVQQRLAEAGPDAARVGMELARSLYEEARRKAAGVYVIPPFREPEAALELLMA